MSVKAMATARNGSSAAEPFLAFARDEQTRATMMQAAEELEFNPASVLAGGIGAAVNLLANMPTPGLLIVDIDDLPDPVGGLEQLAEVCEAHTRVIAIGAQNDIRLYCSLKSMGISEYMVKPMSVEEIVASVRRMDAPTDLASEHDNSGEIHVVIGARGGVGASTIALNAARIWTERNEGRVVMVDMDPFFGTAALQLDIEPGRGLKEALENPSRIDELFIDRASAVIDDRIRLLCGEENPAEPLSYTDEAVQTLTGVLGDHFAAAFFDIPRHRLHDCRSVIIQAKSVVIVSDLTLTALRDVIRIKSAVEFFGTQAEIRLVAQKVGHFGKGEMTLPEFAKAASIGVASSIPFDPELFCKSAEDGKFPCAEARGKSRKAFDQLDIGLFGERSEKSGGIAALIGRFRK